MAVQRKCHGYLNRGCRSEATNSLRRGDHVYHYCDNPQCDPRTVRDHIDTVDRWIAEAAADLEMEEDTVWHDVAVNYVITEVHDPTMREHVCASLGIPLDVVGG